MPKSQVTWHLCNLVSGEILAELPLGIDVVRVKVSEETSANFTLPIADKDCPADWEALLTVGNRMIVLTLDGAPVTGWWVEDIDVDEATWVVTITGYTLEHCLIRANVPDLDASLDDAYAASVVAGSMVARFGFAPIEYTNTGHVSDQSFSTEEDQTVLAALQTMTTAGLIEFRCIVRWADAARRGFSKVLQIAGTIGSTRADAVLERAADGKGNLSKFGRHTSYAVGKGATYLLGASEGSGAARYITAPVVATDLIAAGYPVVEERITFTGLGDNDTDDEIDRRTAAKLVSRRLGRVTYTLVGEANCPRPGVDFDEGDTLPLVVSPLSKTGLDKDGNQRTVVINQSGVNTTVRVLGYEFPIDSQMPTLTLWEEPDV